MLEFDSMSTTLIEIRRAKAADAEAVAATHDEAWRTAYQGIIPGPELEKLISRRGLGCGRLDFRVALGHASCLKAVRRVSTAS